MYEVFDDQFQQRIITKAESELLECADRIETHDGRVFWSSRGNRTWYGEHALQGGLRTIEFRLPATSTVSS